MLSSPPHSADQSARSIRDIQQISKVTYHCTCGIGCACFVRPSPYGRKVHTVEILCARVTQIDLIDIDDGRAFTGRLVVNHRYDVSSHRARNPPAFGPVEDIVSKDKPLKPSICLLVSSQPHSDI
jgi:hypothetical protein